MQRKVGLSENQPKKPKKWNNFLGPNQLISESNFLKISQHFWMVPCRTLFDYFCFDRFAFRPHVMRSEKEKFNHRDVEIALGWKPWWLHHLPWSSSPVSSIRLIPPSSVYCKAEAVALDVQAWGAVQLQLILREDEKEHADFLTSWQSAHGRGQRMAKFDEELFLNQILPCTAHLKGT